MPSVTIPATLPSIEYQVTTAEDEFAVPSYIVLWEQGDLRVYVMADSADEWTELQQVDFTFTGTGGYGDGFPGGVIQLAAAISDSRIRIERDMTMGRSTDFTEGAPVSRAALNMALDRLWAAVIDVNARVRRGAWGEPVYGSDEQPALPADAADRASKFLGFDASGILTCLSVVEAGSLVVTPAAEALLAESTYAAMRTLLDVGRMNRLDIREAPYNALPNATILGDINTPGTAAHTGWAIRTAWADAYAATAGGTPTAVYIPGLPFDIPRATPYDGTYSAWVVDYVTCLTDGVMIGDGPGSRIKQLSGRNITAFSFGATAAWLSTVTLADLTFDCNWEGNTLVGAAPGFYLNCVAAHTENVLITNAGGLLAHFTYDGGDAGRIVCPVGSVGCHVNLTLTGALRECLVFDGPSDTTFVGLEGTNASQMGYAAAPIPDGQPMTAGSYSICRFTSGCKIVNSHIQMGAYVQHPDGQIRPTIKPVASLHTDNVAECIINAANCHFEGAQTPVLLDGTGSVLVGCRIYNCAKPVGTNTGMVRVLKGVQTISACHIGGTLPGTSVVVEGSVIGVQLGVLGTPVTNVSVGGGTVIFNCLTASIDATYSSTCTFSEVTANNCGEAIGATSLMFANMMITNQNPYLGVSDTNAALNEKTVALFRDGLYAYNDAFGSSFGILTWARSGVTVTGVTVAAAKLIFSHATPEIDGVLRIRGIDNGGTSNIQIWSETTPATQFCVDIYDSYRNGAVSTGAALRFFGKDQNDVYTLGGVINGGNEVTTAGATKGDIDFVIYDFASTNPRGFALRGSDDSIVPLADLQVKLGAAGQKFNNIFGRSVTTPSLTFATLPAAPVAGQRCFITDCNTAAFDAAAAGGGANAVPVIYNGAAWRVG